MLFFAMRGSKYNMQTVFVRNFACISTRKLTRNFAYNFAGYFGHRMIPNPYPW